MRKCLFTKKTENVNTSVTIDTEMGHVTVYVSDDQIDKSISDIKTAVDELISKAKEFADTLGVDLQEMMERGGIIQTNKQMVAVVPSQPVAANVVQQPRPAVSVASPGPQTQQSTQMAVQHQDTVRNDLENVSESADVPVPAAGSKNMNVIKSPGGRTFSIPQVMSDAHGRTVFSINQNRVDIDTNTSRRDVNETSYQNGYGVKFIPCKLCVRGGVSTGSVNGDICPKCQGACEIMVL